MQIIPHQGANCKRRCDRTASHAIGTARAMEMGEVEGAMSSLSIAVAGLLTVAFASVFSFFGKETAYLRAKDRILTRKYLGGVDHMKEIKLKADKPFSQQRRCGSHRFSRRSGR